jgi:hypothetical protein
MQVKTLAATAAHYPYLQGLWVLLFGFLLLFTGLSNLHQRPNDALLVGIFSAGLLVCGVGGLLLARYYRTTYGEVTPTRQRQVRHAVAVVAWIAVLFVAGGKLLWWSPDSPLCVYATAFALATLVYYAIVVGLRTHHLVIWGSVLVAGLLPIWGGLGVDRDAVAMFPLGLALIVSGLLDQRLLVRTFASTQHPDLGHPHVGG